MTEALAYSVPRAADLISCSPDYVRKLIREGRLAAVKSGNKTLIRPKAIDDYLNSLPAA